MKFVCCCTTLLSSDNRIKNKLYFLAFYFCKLIVRRCCSWRDWRVIPHSDPIFSFSNKHFLSFLCCLSIWKIIMKRKFILLGMCFHVNWIFSWWCLNFPLRVFFKKKLEWYHRWRKIILKIRLKFNEILIPCFSSISITLYFFPTSSILMIIKAEN
jgi:hypothetical protein